jgi:hypothetical protein
MNLEEIISGAVKNQIEEMVEKMVYNRKQSWDEKDHPTGIEEEVARQITLIAREEVVKHESSIRIAVKDSLANSPARFKITAYSEIEIPPVS